MVVLPPAITTAHCSHSYEAFAITSSMLKHPLAKGALKHAGEHITWRFNLRQLMSIFANSVYLAKTLILSHIRDQPSTNYQRSEIRTSCIKINKTLRIEKYVEMNVAHPFHEGNGRAMRIWLDIMLKTTLEKVVDWSLVDKQDYLLAMERSPIKDTEIKQLLKEALTDKINDHEVFMKGIDAIYSYEGYSTYLTQDLALS